MRIRSIGDRIVQFLCEFPQIPRYGGVFVKEFMELLEEVTDLREQRLRDERNPWQKWVHFAATIDAWRIFPRIFISVYMYLLYYNLTF